MKKQILNLISLVSLLAVSFIGYSQTKKPNILLIVADDLGYSDISSFGSEIQTPHIDSLAANGARFNKFYVSPMCVTSRVAMISGMEYIAAGKNNLPNGTSVASLMRDKGYATSLVGKNHGLGAIKIGDTNADFGFDHFYGFTGGQINSFTGQGDVKWQEDGKRFPYTDLPADFYATNYFTKYTIEHIKAALENDKPFFNILSYNAPHSPLDAPEENVRKYYNPDKGINVYASGWNKMREEKLERMIALGIIDPGTKLAKLGVEIPDWDLLPQTSKRPWELQQDFEALSRSAYAGMVDNLDLNIGAIISFLKDPNNDGDTRDSQLENTLIIFISDNGGCYAGLHTNRDALPWSPDKRGAGFTTNYGWAALSNTPFNSYKHGSGEGAIRSPMVVHWPDGLKLEKNSIHKEMLRIWDIYPTFLEIAGAQYPSDKKPLMGKSFLPLLQNEAFSPDDFFVSTFYRSKGLIKGDWKLVSYYDSPFELYNLKEDPTETNNVRNKHQIKYKQLLNAWNNYTVAQGFSNDKEWNMPVGAIKRDFGYDRINPLMTSTQPAYMADNVALNQKLTLSFKGTVSFAGTKGKVLRLQKYGDTTILWSKDLDETSVFEGKKQLIFDDFPALEPDTHYYITWDAGWVKVLDNGKLKTITPVQESAFAYRFKTKKTVNQ